VKGLPLSGQLVRSENMGEEFLVVGSWFLVRSEQPTANSLQPRSRN
jgi:hypothetical protein